MSSCVRMGDVCLKSKQGPGVWPRRAHVKVENKYSINDLHYAQQGRHSGQSNWSAHFLMF